MSDKPKPSKESESAVDLSALDFGPSWARGDAPAKEKKFKDYEPREGRGGDRGGRGGDKRGRQGGGDRRGGGAGGGRRFEGGGGRGERKFDKDDRHGKGRGRRDGKGGPDHRDERRRDEAPAPDGVKGQILPVEDGLDRLAKEILGGGRTYSVFDLAKLVMGARDRFNVGFKSDGSVKILRCRKDGAVWLTKAEALRHFARADWRKDFYREITDQAEPPKGSFQAIAVCGFSGEILGPPNYHDYQPAIARIHAERFANMSLDRYKAKIRMEKGEEAVNAWLEKMSRRVRYLPVTADESAAKEEKPEEEGIEAEGIEAEGAEVEGAEVEGAEVEGAEVEGAEVEGAEVEGAEVEGAEVEGAEVEGTEAEEAAEPDPVYDEKDLLDDLRAVEEHFAKNYFTEVYVESDRVWVPGNIPGNNLSPGLLTLLRETVSEERRYPSKLTPMLCRQLSGRHVAVFKWKKKLKAGPSRPHEIPADIQLAERPQKLLDWVRGHSGGNLEKLWGALLPKEVTDEVKHEWYHDLHWLLNQGYILLLSDSTLAVAKADPGPKQGKKPVAKKKAPKEAKPAAPAPEPQAAAPESQGAVSEPQTAAPEPQAEVPEPQAAAPEPQAEAPSNVEEAAATPEEPVATPEGPEATPKKPAGSPGLYRLQGKRLSGEAVLEEEFAGSGLWPKAAKHLAEEEDPAEGEESTD